MELLTEFFEDLFAKDKSALLDASRGADGEIEFSSTGDELIDKWERELAMGLEPDLTEGMTKEAKDSMIKNQENSNLALKKLQEVSSINDEFGMTSATGTLGSGYTPAGLSPLDILGRGK